MAGQPPIFKTPKAFEEKVDEYFTWIKGEFTETEELDEEENPIVERQWTRHPEPPTITGMCLFLGFESRQSFHDYQEREGFSYTVKRARMRIESEYEKNLYSKQPVGSIFALKNLGWKDKQEVEQSGGLKITAIWDKTLLPSSDTEQPQQE